VRYINPLLSTVTYLTDSGGPTVGLAYTMSDMYIPDRVPQAGFISMPARNKHLAFDPRLFHGVLGGLHYDNAIDCNSSNFEDNRIILGMNFWELQTRETMPRSMWGRIRQKVQAWFRKATDEEDYVSMPTHDFIVKYPRSKSLLQSGNTELLTSSVRQTSETREAQLFSEQCPESVVPGDKATQWSKISAFLQSDDFPGEKAFVIPTARLGIGFKPVRWAMKIALRFPIEELLIMEGKVRGQILTFELSCQDVLLEEIIINQTQTKPYHDDIAVAILKNRCKLAESEQILIPPTAAEYCRGQVAPTEL